MVLSRGPYHYDDEHALLAEHRADVLVTKGSGGSYTWGKMAAADALGVPIVVVHRTPAQGGSTVVNDVASAAAWIEALS